MNCQQDVQAEMFSRQEMGVVGTLQRQYIARDRNLEDMELLKEVTEAETIELRSVWRGELKYEVLKIYF